MERSSSSYTLTEPYEDSTDILRDVATGGNVQDVLELYVKLYEGQPVESQAKDFYTCMPRMP